MNTHTLSAPYYFDANTFEKEYTYAKMAYLGRPFTDDDISPILQKHYFAHQEKFHLQPEILSPKTNAQVLLDVFIMEFNVTRDLSVEITKLTKIVSSHITSTTQFFDDLSNLKKHQSDRFAFNYAIEKALLSQKDYIKTYPFNIQSKVEKANSKALLTVEELLQKH